MSSSVWLQQRSHCSAALTLFERKLRVLTCLTAADADAIEPPRAGAGAGDSMEGDEASNERGSEASSTSCHNINVAVRFRPLRYGWRTLDRVRVALEVCVTASAACCKLALRRPGVLANSEREVERGESEIWGIVAPDTVGVLDGLGLRARYGFDYVFAGAASNAEVPSQALRCAWPAVPGPALRRAH